MADEGVESDDDYDEDIDESEADDEETWNKLSTPLFKNSIDITSSTTHAPKTTESGASTASIIDPYFTHFDPRTEHQSYKVGAEMPIFEINQLLQFHPENAHFSHDSDAISSQEAQQRLEETHREKVTRVMKEWSDLEENYQDMRMADPKAAQSFKQRMTARFQVTKKTFSTRM